MAGAHCIASEMRENIIWVGRMVLVVTLLIELSTTNRADLSDRCPGVHLLKLGDPSKEMRDEACLQFFLNEG